MRMSMWTAAVLVSVLTVCSVAVAGQLDPGKLEYLGAFKPPSHYAYTNGGLAFDPTGNSGAGSMLSFGHAWYSNLGEYDIPDQGALLKKADGWTYADLAVANALKVPPGSNPPNEPGGGGYSLEYIDETDKAAWGREGNGATHGLSDTDGLNEVGRWALAGVDMRRTGHYISEIPRGWVGTNLPAGQIMTTGFGWAGYGRGPSLYAYDPDSPDGNSQLPATKLIEYSSSHPWADFDRDDLWEGSAWLELGADSAFLLGGRKDTTNQGNDTAAPDTFAPWLLFYDPDDLAAVAATTKQTWEPVPYAQVDMSAIYFGTSALGFDAMALDRANGILYVQEDEATAKVVHVFQIVPEPATMALLGLGLVAMAVAKRRRRS